MLPITWYLLKVIACSAILYGYYYIALRNKMFNHYNRFYLLMVIILSLVIPLMKFTIWGTGNSKLPVMHLIQFISSGDEFVYTHSNTNYFHFDITASTIVIYLMIAALLIVQLIRTILKIERLKSTFPASLLGAINFRNTNASGTPFSFFNNIFWSQAIDLNTSTGKQILQHEITHVREKHSHDKLFINIILAFYWCNPIFWIIRSELNLIHEFTADNKAIADKDTSTFVAMILEASYPKQQFMLTNNFFYSPLKRRINMLTKNNNPRLSYITRLMVLPLTALVFFAFTFKMNVPHLANIYHGKSLTIFIDAGHGGEDHGAIANGISEKDITLMIAQRVKELNTNNNLHIVLARDVDKTLSPKERINYSISVHPDLYVSLHFDAEQGKSTNKSGLQVIIPGNDNPYFAQSNLLGSSMLESFKTGYQLNVNNILLQRSKGVWILHANTCPAILMELAFLTTSGDVAYVSKRINLDQIAKNIITGIENYALAATDKALTPMPAVRDTLPVISLVKSGDPLIVIDGVEKGWDKKVYSTINPNKIASVNVLKKEMAFAKYGDKGKYGVIEIFTKTATSKDTAMEYAEKASSPTTVANESASGKIEISSIPSERKLIFTKAENPPQFPGGEKAWVNYITQYINNNIEALDKSNVEGTCMVRFIVDETGAVSDVKALTQKGTKLAEVVIKAITKGPSWIPATQNRHIVSCYKEIPVTFKITD